MLTAGILIVLLLVTTLYAVFLERYKHRWEPDYTWIEVAVGVLACGVAFAGLCAVQLGGAWWSAVTLFTAVFVVGGLPIVAWQVRRMVVQRDREIKRREAQRKQEGRWLDEPAAALAEERGVGEAANGGTR